jgi:hypothetical protein
MKKVINFIKSHKNVAFEILAIIIIIIDIIFTYVAFQYDHNQEYINALSSYMKRMYELCNDSTVITDDLGATDLVRMNDAYMNNPDNRMNVSISTMDEMNEFVDNLAGVENSNNWVNSYIRYSAWHWAEFSLDEESDEYWHMKYVSSSMSSGCNYLILITYKNSGFFIKYSSVIAFVCMCISIFVWVLLVLITITRPWRKANKDINEDDDESHV